MYNWQKILVAVNDSDDATHAVHYVGNVTKSVSDVQISLLYVYPDPPPDYYHKGGSMEAYREIMLDQGRKVIKLAVKTLREYGLSKENIRTDIRLAEGKTISQVILDEQNKQDFNTLVVGKRGISKNEEFLYGSISNNIARGCKGFTVWIVG